MKTAGNRDRRPWVTMGELQILHCLPLPPPFFFKGCSSHPSLPKIQSPMTSIQRFTTGRRPGEGDSPTVVRYEFHGLPADAQHMVRLFEVGSDYIINISNGTTAHDVPTPIMHKQLNLSFIML